MNKDSDVSASPCENLQQVFFVCSKADWSQAQKPNAPVQIQCACVDIIKGHQQAHL